MRRRGRFALLVVVVVGAALLAACGSEGTASSESTATAVTTVTTEPATTSTLPSCGVVTTDLLSTALGVDATFLGIDASGCGFEAGQWTIGVNAVAYDPAVGAGSVTSPTIPGLSVPHSAFLTNDRGGSWLVHAQFVVDGSLYILFLHDDAQGSDTYPPVDGPAQRPLTAAAATAIIEAIAAGQ